MAERTYTSAIARLRLLPEIFTGSDLTVLFGWRSTIASSYLAQWRKTGLVKSLGGRSDVHMNLVRNPQATPEMALRRAFPTAVKVGIDRLRAAGWTTQIAARPEVAISANSTRYSVEEFDLVIRSGQWFELVKPATQSVKNGVDSLAPAWALADMIARAQDKRVRKAWLPDPEDLDLHALSSPKTQQDLQNAWRAFGLAPQTFSRSGYAQIYSQLNTAQ
jgi:hypothetical protein